MQHVGGETNTRIQDLWHNTTHQGQQYEYDNEKEVDLFKLGPIPTWTLLLISEEYIDEDDKR